MNKNTPPSALSVSTVLGNTNDTSICQLKAHVYIDTLLKIYNCVSWIYMCRHSWWYIICVKAETTLPPRKIPYEKKKSTLHMIISIQFHGITPRTVLNYLSYAVWVYSILIAKKSMTLSKFAHLISIVIVGPSMDRVMYLSDVNKTEMKSHGNWIYSLIWIWLCLK